MDPYGRSFQWSQVIEQSVLGDKDEEASFDEEVCMYVCMYVCIYMYAYMYVCMYVCVLWLLLSSYIWNIMLILNRFLLCCSFFKVFYLHLCMYICMCMYVYVCVCI